MGEKTHYAVYSGEEFLGVLENKYLFQAVNYFATSKNEHGFIPITATEAEGKPNLVTKVKKPNLISEEEIFSNIGVA